MAIHLGVGTLKYAQTKIQLRCDCEQEFECSALANRSRLNLAYALPTVLPYAAFAELIFAAFAARAFARFASNVAFLTGESLRLALHSAAKRSYLLPQRIWSLRGAPMSSRTELEEVWQSRVRAAREQYEERIHELDRVVAESEDDVNQQPDGSESTRQARRLMSGAFKEYMRLLRIYTDLVMYGKVPQEPNS